VMRKNAHLIALVFTALAAALLAVLRPFAGPPAAPLASLSAPCRIAEAGTEGRFRYVTGGPVFSSRWRVAPEWVLPDWVFGGPSEWDFLVKTEPAPLDRVKGELARLAAVAPLAAGIDLTILLPDRAAPDDKGGFYSKAWRDGETDLLVIWPWAARENAVEAVAAHEFGHFVGSRLAPPWRVLDWYRLRSGGREYPWQRPAAQEAFAEGFRLAYGSAKAREELPYHNHEALWEDGAGWDSAWEDAFRAWFGRYLTGAEPEGQAEGTENRRLHYRIWPGGAPEPEEGEGAVMTVRGLGYVVEYLPADAPADHQVCATVFRDGGREPLARALALLEAAAPEIREARPELEAAFDSWLRNGEAPPVEGRPCGEKAVSYGGFPGAFDVAVRCAPPPVPAEIRQKVEAGFQ